MDGADATIGGAYLSLEAIRARRSRYMDMYGLKDLFSSGSAVVAAASDQGSGSASASVSSSSGSCSVSASVSSSSGSGNESGSKVAKPVDYSQLEYAVAQIELMGRQIEIVSMPWELAPCTRPLVMQPLTTHRVLDISCIRAELGYRDAVPAREALARTARWLAEYPPAAGGIEEMVLEDPFDYAAEDRLRGAWEAAIGGMPRIGFDPQPGYTMSYSGPGGRDRSNNSFTG